MTELSPQAQSVRNAVLNTYADNVPKDDNLWNLERASTVAVLRTVANEMAKQYADETMYDSPYSWLENIAIELENQ